MTVPSETDPLFLRFFELVRQRAVQELNLDVTAGLPPYTIQWGAFADPRLYTFDPRRAQTQGLDRLVDEAISRIREQMP